VLEALHVRAEVKAGEQPHARERVAYVVGIALVEVGARDARLDLLRDGPAELRGYPCGRGAIHGAVAARATAGPTRDRVAGARGLDEHHLHARRHEPLALAAEAAARGAAKHGRDPLNGVPGVRRVERRGGVQADDDIELLVAQDVQVRGGPQTAVHVAAAPDLDRLVEARDRTGGGHGLGEIGPRGVLAPDRAPAAVGV